MITNLIIAECAARDNHLAGISFDIEPEGNLIVDTQVIDNGSSYKTIWLAFMEQRYHFTEARVTQIGPNYAHVGCQESFRRL